MDNISGTIPAQDTIDFSIHFFTSSDQGEGDAILNFQDQGRTASFTHSFKARTYPTNVLSGETAKLTYKLFGNYPNPFNSSTTIRFETADKTRALKFKVYSLNGQLIHEQEFENFSAGLNQISFNGTDFKNNKLPSSIYFYQLLLTTPGGIKKIFTSRFVILN